MKNKNITTWTDLKDDVYGKKGTPRRDKLDREFKSLKIGFQLTRSKRKKEIDPRPIRVYH